jgi:hypothetical protein
MELGVLFLVIVFFYFLFFYDFWVAIECATMRIY